MRRLISIGAAVPTAVATAIGVILLLDAVLPYGKSWQMPVIFGGGFLAAIVAGVATMRAICPFAKDTPSLPGKHPLD